ncbi:MAG TPA: hypothetical protein VD862_01530 [Candidatus Paceibacterota bacterium]|nr:hypothetical protein [Candidatus Paceibacterota bacterium]
MRNYWFKARFFGWGWYPATWQGWAVLAVWGLWLALLIVLVNPEADPLLWITGLLGSVGVLIGICWKKGERPSWRWAGEPASAGSVLLRALAIVAYVAVLFALIARFAS